MSCPSYLTSIKTDSKSCNGLIISSQPPLHNMTEDEKQCIGLNLTLDEWQSKWETSDCIEIFQKMIYPNNKYSYEGFRNAVADYNYMFYTYYGPYDAISNPKGGHIISSNDSMSNLLINSCSKNQGVCQCVSLNFCQNCTSTIVNGDPLLRELCGCYCNNFVATLYNIPNECEETCANVTSSKHRNFISGVVDSCKKKVCFLDTNQIYTYDEACPHCSEDDCECIISGDSDSEMFSNKCKKIRRLNNKKRRIYDDEQTSESTSMNTFIIYFMFILIIILSVCLILLTAINEQKLADKVPIDTKVPEKINIAPSFTIPLVNINESQSNEIKIEKPKIEKYKKEKQKQSLETPDYNKLGFNTLNNFNPDQATIKIN